MRSRWPFSLITLSVLSAVAWRLEIEHYGWEGLTWTGSPHRTLPAGLIAFILWALAAARLHHGWTLARLAAYGAALVALALVSTSLLLFGMAITFSRFGAGIGGFAWLAAVWLAQPFALFALARFVFQMRVPWHRLAAGALTWLAALPLACFLLLVVRHDGGSDFLHAIKSGFVIPFLFTGLGLVLLPWGERSPAPREDVRAPIAVALVVVMFVTSVAWWRASSRDAAARDLAHAIEHGNWRVVFPGLRGVLVFPPVENVPEHGSPVDPDFAVTADLRRAAFVEHAPETGRTRLVVLDSRGEVASLPITPNENIGCPRFGTDGSLFVRVSDETGKAHIERVEIGGAGLRERVELSFGLPDPGGPYTPLPCFDVSSVGSFGWVSRQTNSFHVVRPGTVGPGSNRTFPGDASYELSPDGSWVAVRTGSGLGRIEMATGERQFIARTDDDLVAISPDGAWIAARHGERGGLHALVEGHGRGRYVAWRVADGAGPVALPGVPDDATGFGFVLWIRYDPAP